MTIKELLSDCRLDFSYHAFRWGIMKYGTDYTRIRINNDSFVIDENNEKFIKNLYLYTIGDDKCEWNLEKGLFVGGKIGCGKTTIMRAYTDMLSKMSGFNVQYFRAPELYITYKHYGIESLKRRPILIDELGREQLEIYVDGARIRPIEDLMAMRYEYGALTFFTSNFKISTLSAGYDDKGKKIGYGEYIGDRLREMCNEVVLPGDSRR